MVLKKTNGTIQTADYMSCLCSFKVLNSISCLQGDCTWKIRGVIEILLFQDQFGTRSSKILFWRLSKYRKNFTGLKLNLQEILTALTNSEIFKGNNLLQDFLFYSLFFLVTVGSKKDFLKSCNLVQNLQDYFSEDYRNIEKNLRMLIISCWKRPTKLIDWA